MFFLIFSIALLFFAFLAWRDIRIATILFFGLFPTYLLRISIFGIPTTLLEIFFLILFIVWFFRYRGSISLYRLFLKEGQNRQYRIFFVSVLLMILTASIGLFMNPQKMAALGIWKAYFIEPVLFFLLTVSVLKTVTYRKWALIAFAASGIVVALFAIFQFFTAIGIPVPWDTERRVTSLFPYPNAIGLFLGPLVTMSFFFLFSHFFTLSLKKRSFLFWVFIVLFGSFALFLSQTEAAWIAVPAAIIIVSFFVRPLRRFTIPLITLGIIVVLLLPAIHVPLVQKLSLQDFSGQVRLKQWEETAYLLKDHWVFGAGLSGYPYVLTSYRLYPEIEVFQYPHQLFFNIWTELGLMGLVSFILLSFFVLVSFFSSLKKQKEPDWILLALFAVFLEMVIHGFVDVPYFKNDLAMMTWGFLALYVGQVNMKKKMLL